MHLAYYKVACINGKSKKKPDTLSELYTTVGLDWPYSLMCITEVVYMEELVVWWQQTM
jgi:hypothetical protein